MPQFLSNSKWTFRPYEPSDLNWLVALNNANLPAVSPLDVPSGERLMAEARLGIIAFLQDTPVAALVAFAKGADYGSTNYRWFCQNMENFLYIDRVMVEEAQQNQGLGAALYSELAELGKKAGFSALTCEVNEEPPNPGSMRFHERLGFEKLTSRINEADGKRVAMLIKPF